MKRSSKKRYEYMADPLNNFHKEVGIVTSAKEYLLSLQGLPSAHINDLIKNEWGSRAIITALDIDEVEALLLDSTTVKPGDRFFLEGDPHIFSFGEHLFGRTINTLGEYIDGKPAGHEPKDYNARLELNVVAKGGSFREPIKDQFVTGITFVDTLFPIGKGQRQLLFGPIRSGKTTFLQDVISNQNAQGSVCIYASIGKPVDDIRKMASGVFREKGGKNAIILAALSSDPSPLIAIAPSVAFSIAEFFAVQGRDVLIILDDLGTHAKYLREIALLQGRLPGRESYPGDIFYQHAHLMERSGHFNAKVGGGTITLLPVLETDIQNNTDLIPTNLMACTDGHFSLSSELRAQGYYPTILDNRSVTRVGRNTQKLVQKQLGMKIIAWLAEYKEQEEYSRFGAQVSIKTQETLRRGAMIREVLHQEPFEFVPLPVQLCLLALATTPFLTGRGIPFFRKNRKVLMETIASHKSFEDVRVMAGQDVSLENFIWLIMEKTLILENVCQQ
ncbi:MAG: ATP synthase subunit alpha [Parcubacteria group bacterium GW2011_GWA1_47_8]|nr:MAG: ATP synthase subunit alpha [Parcubacteria group bacterium GW2011_GWA1_47_8]